MVRDVRLWRPMSVFQCVDCLGGLRIVGIDDGGMSRKGKRLGEKRSGENE
jgi:hypothetical protein